MGVYPVGLKIEGRRCLVIGGGKVAERKVLALLDCGADIVVISPDVTQRIEEITGRGEIGLLKRQFQAEDLEGAFLAIAATDDVLVNEKVASEGKVKGVLVNVVDVPDLCDFYVPATVTRGDLQISVSTDGGCPALARKLRIQLENEFGEEYGEFLCLLRSLRDNLKEKVDSPEKRRMALEDFISSPALMLLSEGRLDEVEGIYQKCLFRYVD